MKDEETNFIDTDIFYGWGLRVLREADPKNDPEKKDGVDAMPMYVMMFVVQ